MARAPHSVDKRVWLSVLVCEWSRGLALSLCLACCVGSMTLQLVVTCVPLAAEGNTLLGWLVAPLPCGLALC